MPNHHAVIFDAFGTILQIKGGSHPFRRLLQEGIQQGRRPQPDDAHVLMTNPLSLEGAARHFGIKISAQELQCLEDDLAKEVDGVEAFEDALLAVQALQEAGIKVGVCSNLAMPYAAAIERLFPALDAFTYSFAIGALKPDRLIYEDICQKLGTKPDHTYMIGDSKRCDRDGPRVVGINSHHLSRDEALDFNDLQNFAEFVLHSVKNRDF
jgi:HAD superfamily hydrolase (TIGR01549 family)